MRASSNSSLSRLLARTDVLEVLLSARAQRAPRHPSGRAGEAPFGGPQASEPIASTRVISASLATADREATRIHS